jgi:hypothetical protein
MAATLPNFFVIGSARCGTTLLHGLLGQHPQIYFGPTKEPSFFCRRPHQVTDAVGYLREFDGVTDEIAVGEASHAYLTDPDTPRLLNSFFPDARLVVIVRNPADRARALYLLMRSLGWEPAATFERALALEGRRFERQRVPMNGLESFWMFMYFRSGLFGEQIARWLEHYPRRQIHVITLYDLVSRPDDVLGGVHDFLGVDRLPAPHVERVNASQGVRWFPLKFVERQLVHRLWNRGVPLTAPIEGQLRQFNDTPVPAYDPVTRAVLSERYRPDLERFAELTGVDVLEAERRRGEAAPPSSRGDADHATSVRPAPFGVDRTPANGASASNHSTTHHSANDQSERFGHTSRSDLREVGTGRG